MDTSKESDDDLVGRIRNNSDQQAFRVLVERHNPRVLGRFIKSCGNRQDAEDLCQQLWTRVAGNIDNYQAQGKFEHYVNKISTNLLHSHRDQSKRRQERISDADFDPDTSRGKTTANNEQRAQVEQLVTELIPKLSVEQRTAFLLRHESEFWQHEQRLSWNDLGMLNGVDADTAWQRFDSFRRKIFAGDIDGLRDSEEACVFFVWSQSQRPGKQFRYGDEDFCELLNIKPETFRTRYRTALRNLVLLRKGEDDESERK